MARAHAELGSPEVLWNDRFWLVGDHVVRPTIMKHPKIAALVNQAEKAKKDFKMTEYQGMNYTVMHTEFVRERAEPGILILGSDSHTHLAGAVGCLSIGFGTADVTMALSTGETWFKAPESILINFAGAPAFGMSGKDVILYILKALKRTPLICPRWKLRLQSTQIRTMWCRCLRKQECTSTASSSVLARLQRKNSCWRPRAQGWAAEEAPHWAIAKGKSTTSLVHCQLWRS